MEMLESRGADIRYHDPYVPELRETNVHRVSVALTDAELESADCVVVVTDHSDIDYRRVVARSKLIVDTRNVAAGMVGGRVVRLSGGAEAQRG